MDMFAINKYKRKPVTDVSIKVYLNGRVFTEAGGHSAEAMGDKEIVQKVLSLALDSFFQPSSDMKKKYDFALEYFSRLRDNMEPKEKRIAELEEKISVLLSCKNCPENKDGLICQKEYEGKCLAQKIQYIKELKEENAELKAQIEKKMEEIRTDNTETLKNALERIAELEKENAELKKVAEFQQSSNMSRHFENKKLKEVLAVGSTFNKALNSMNKSLEEERDKYRNMVFDKNDQLTEAKKIIEELYNIIPASMSDYAKEPMEHARKFMTEE